jgi:GH15 family glucan-1,4-alpha-glucosidase
MLTPSLDLAVIGNGQIASLIDARGAHVFTCLPRLDGDPVFCSLLGPRAPHEDHGRFEVCLEGFVTGERRYVRNTPIVETLLHGGDGAAVRLVDFCPRFRQFDRIFRPAMLVRIVEPLAGQPRIRVALRPMADYGSRVLPARPGSHHVRYSDDGIDLRLTTDASLQYVMEEQAFRLDRRLTFVLGPDESITESVERLGERFLGQTRDYWWDWVRELAVPVEWQEAVIRAAITLKLCSFEDTGAIVAALTTSIPESPDSGRNWDYRCCWLRDSYYTVQALNRLGKTRTMEYYLRFILNVAARAPGGLLQPVYGITGAPDLDERLTPALAGYRGMGPVRVGNAAYRQAQHDGYGAVILTATQAFFDERLTRPAGPDVAATLEQLGEQAWALHARPDAGLWEYRSRSEVHTYSATMCWAGLDRLARIAARLGLASEATWRTRADAVRRTVLERGWNARLGAFTDVFEGEHADASLLTLPEIGLVRWDDPRFRGTLAFVEGRLRRGDHLARYERADDFGAPDVAFNLCTFWYILALAGVGRVPQARDLFEGMLRRRNPVGLLSEDVDPIRGEAFGNFPQTYSLVGLIHAAMRLSQPWETAL